MSVESIPATAGFLAPLYAPSGHDDTGEVRQDLRGTKLLSCAVDLLVVFYQRIRVDHSGSFLDDVPIHMFMIFLIFPAMNLHLLRNSKLT